MEMLSHLRTRSSNLTYLRHEHLGEDEQQHDLGYLLDVDGCLVDRLANVSRFVVTNV